MPFRSPFITILVATGLLISLASPSASAAEQCIGEWSVVPTDHPGGNNAVIRDMAVVSPTDIWAVGDYWTNNSEAFAMHYNGISWTQHPVPLVNEWGSSALWAVAAKDGEVWAAGYRVYTPSIPNAYFGMHIFVLRWNGSQWVAMNTPALGGGSGDHVLDIEIAGPNDVWFFGEGHPIAVQPQPALAMHWNGSSFSVINTPQVNPQVSGFGNGNSLWAGSALNANEIWAVGAAGDGDSLPCQHSQIMRWSGSQWQHIPAAALNCYWHSLYAVEAIAPNDVWAGGEYEDANGYHGLALHYNGSGWTQIPVPGGITDFHAFASDDVYAVGGNVMHWDGDVWSVVETFAEVYGPSLWSIGFAGDCQMFAAGRKIDGETIAPLTVEFNPSAPIRIADITGDGTVNVADMLAVINSWGNCASCPADISPSPNGDGVVNVADLMMVLNDWG
jgi:hypothetical protein